MQDFKQLEVWQRSHKLTLAIYEATVAFPKDEAYGLTSQLRRLAASIPANIAEGCGRSGPAELSRFLQIAMGSASETEYHLLLARDLGFLDQPNYERLNIEITGVKRMLTGLIRTVALGRRGQAVANRQPMADGR